MQCVLFVSEGKLYQASAGKAREWPSAALDAYRQTVAEIHSRRDWKTSGTGAQFMGMMREESGEAHTAVECLAGVDGERVIYAVSMDTSCGLYCRNPQEPAHSEEYVMRRIDTRMYHIDHDPVHGMLVGTVSEGHQGRHLAICGERGDGFRVLTEGDSVDITPVFAQRNPRQIYFSSAGFYRGKNGLVYSSYGLNRLDLDSSEIEELLTDEKYDYILPREDDAGNLYCIRRVRRDPHDDRMTLTDVLLMPVRLLKGIFGWLNFFTQRYSGDPLIKKSGGPNPGKYDNRSDEELFIEGNMINVQKTLKENAMQGEAYPGLAPRSWELCRVGDGKLEVRRSGVLDYAFDAQGRLYWSNGKYVLREDDQGGEEVVCEARVARSLCPVEIVEGARDAQ